MATQGGRSSFHLEPGGGRKEETLHEMRTLHDSNGGHFDSLCYVHSFRSRIREEVKELSKFSWCAASMIRIIDIGIVICILHRSRILLSLEYIYICDFIFHILA